MIRAWTAWVDLWDRREAPTALALVRIGLGLAMLLDQLHLAWIGMVTPLFARPPDGFAAAYDGWASSLLGTHDFAAFRSSMDTRTETVRTIESVQVETLPRDPRILIIDVVGNAFMHNMVRIIVGSLLDVARGHLPRGTLAKALLGGTRADLGMTAPAHGLCLETIEHSLALEEVWP